MAHQSGYQTTNSVELMDEYPKTGLIKITKSVSNDEFRFQLTGRALGVGKKMCKFLSRMASSAFGDIGRYRHSCTPNLAGEP